MVVIIIGSGSGSGTSAVIDGCLFVYLFWLDWIGFDGFALG